MRLTLRTLLAYLDGVLNEEEAEQLKHRIDESEFATTLVQRIRHIVKRTRLNAPKVDGRGLGADPNSVAEYFDNTMPPDRIVDFEKVCLESDVHLAEVAACHEILAKLFDEHPQVSPAFRDRMRQLKDRARTTPKSSPATLASSNGQSPPAPPAIASAVVAEPAPAVHVERPKPQVPDYLKPDPREKRAGNGWMLIPIGLLALLGVAFFVPPLNNYNPLLKTQLAEVPDSQRDTSPSDGPADQNDNSEDGKLKDGTTENQGADTATPADKKPVIDADAGVEPAEPTETPDPNENTTSDPEKPVVVDPETAVADRGTKPEDPPEPPMPPEVPEQPPVKPAPEESPSGMELGRYISDETILATYDDKDHTWQRVPPRALIADRQKYVSLPIYRPQIALSSGAQITLVGEGSVSFTRRSPNELPQLQVEFGRLLLQSIALPNVQTELNLNGVKGTLTLDTPDSVAAIEVYQYLTPGRDPLADDADSPITAVAHIMGVEGTCTWSQGDMDPVTIGENFIEVFSSDGETRRQGPVYLPKWIDPSNTSRLDRETLTVIEPSLATDRPLDLSLEEQANHRRLDVRVHVARCLAFLDRYEVLIKHLSDEQYKAYWLKADGYVDILRRQLARGGSTAEELQRQLVEVRGERDGMAMYRLLQGYSPEQLVNGSDEQLVIGLAQPNMDLRVLSIDNLYRITGAMHLYNASQPPEKSRSIKTWEELRKDGKIRYASKPSPFTDFKPRAEKEDPK